VTTVRTDWFVACRFTTVRRVGGDHRPWAGSAAHAKRMGTNLTACGQPATTMTKLFEVPFPIQGENCPECVAVVVTERRERASNGRRGGSRR
jgi:hypothetical protein